MEEFNDVSLTGPLGVAARLFRRLPLPASLAIGRSLGRVGYFVMSKKRKLVYANLKTAFCQDRSPAELRRLSCQVFINLTQSFVELMCIGKMKRIGFDSFVELRGQSHVDQAFAQGKGVIFLAIHSGNWELGSVFNGLTGYTYNIVANQQPKMPQLGVLLNEARAMAGAHVIAPGVATKEIINALKRNEILGLVLDQGGADGVMVDLFGKPASMSSGAVRLALKYDVSICPAWITRQASGTHVLEFFPAIALSKSGEIERDIQSNVQQATAVFEALLRKHPQEYLWFYKVYKYSTQAKVLLLTDDQAESSEETTAKLDSLTDSLSKQGKKVEQVSVRVVFQSRWTQEGFKVYALLAHFLGCLRNEDCLKLFLTADSYANLMKVKADHVVSSGKRLAAVNWILAQNHQAASIT